VIVFRAAGTYGSALVVPEGALTAKPPALSWEQAAGLLLAGATAVHALEATRVASGDLVLAHGAAGSVGQLLVQLARRRGASVIGTALPRNHALLRLLGATAVEYGDGLVERVRPIGAPTVAFDLVGTDEAFDISLALVADRTRVVTIVNAPRFLAAVPAQLAADRARTQGPLSVTPPAANWRRWPARVTSPCAWRRRFRSTAPPMHCDSWAKATPMARSFCFRRD
jgi:NADPH:quinone reductase-like Zn-dependent oxidoreductase